MRFVYATDCHGNMKSYSETMQAAKKRSIKNIIFGGDVSPRQMALVLNKELMIVLPYGIVVPYTEKIEKSGNFLIVHIKEKSVDIEKLFGEYYSKFKSYQSAWLSSVLLEEIKKFKKTYDCTISIFGGNNDPKKLVQIFNEAESDGIIKHIHCKSFEAEDVVIAGYPFISPTPFLFEYWEKPEKEIYTELKTMAKKIDIKKTLLFTHVPPKNTPLDMIPSGRHVGSAALRRFIENHQPLACMSGHLHESPRVSGKWQYKIGKSICINHGASEDKTNILLGDTEKKEFKILKNF